MQNWMRSAAVFTAVSLMTASIAFAAPPEATGDYLVGLTPGTKANRLGVQVKSEFAEINAAHVKASKNALERLQAKGFIEYFEEDAKRYAMGTYSDGTYTWGLQAVRAPEAWALGATGSGIRVCVLDTGIDYSHPEFFKNGVSIIKGSKNFVNDGHPDAKDGNGHGTHVAGTIAGQLNNSGSYIGVAPNVDLYIGRVLGDDGSGSSSGIINGVKWCTDTVQAHIISMSLGGGRYSKTEDRTYNSVYSKGVLPIAAAGNDGTTNVSYPAGYKNVVSVGAVDSNLVKASFSQYNSDVELAGPGVATLSAVPLGTGEKSTAAEGTTTYANKKIEYAANGSVSGQLVECGLGDSTTSCTGIPSTGAWIAVVSRGSISFADKAKNVMAQGASAMILTNNDTASPDDAGSFTFGSAGTWLPAVSVSYNSGVAIRNGGLSTGTVAIEPWDYSYFNGTSMATPHVSAVAALAWSAKPTLSNVTIRDVLAKTAKDLGATGRDTYYGYGLVQADAAVNSAKAR